MSARSCLEDVRHGVPRLRQPVRGRPAHAAHRLALDRSPAAEIRQGGRAGRRSTRPPLRTADAARRRSRRPSRCGRRGPSPESPEVDAELARETSRGRRRWNRGAAVAPRRRPRPGTGAAAGLDGSSRRLRLSASPGSARPSLAAACGLGLGASPAAPPVAAAGCFLGRRVPWAAVPFPAFAAKAPRHEMVCPTFTFSPALTLISLTTRRPRRGLQWWPCRFRARGRAGLS